MPLNEIPARAPAPAAGMASLLPDFCSLPMVLGVVVYGELLAVLLALASPHALASVWTRLGPLSVYVQFVVLISAGLMCLARAPLRRRDRRLGAPLAWLLIVGTALAVTLGMARLLPADLLAPLLPEDGVLGLLIRALLIAAIMGALLLRYLYLHQQWRAQVEAVANARFKTLQARIRPHFLFNSMNTIASLTQSDPRLAEEIVVDLADLFRASLATEVETTTLGAELELARRYLNIERQRLGERLRLHWDLVGLPDAAPLPPLILQPLVENAVYHGIQPSAEPGDIRIVGRYHRGRVELIISNSLPDRAASEAPARRGNRMALDNVSQRMQAMFPGAARVIHARHAGEYVVRLAFPFPWRQA